MALQIMGGAPAQQPQKEDAWDRVAKALGVVNQVTGTALNVAQFQEALANNKLKRQQAEQVAVDQKTTRDELVRKKAGIKTPGEFQDIQLSGNMAPAKEGEPGAIPVQVEGPDGSPLIQFVKSTKGKPTENQDKNLALRGRQVVAAEERNKLEREKLAQEITVSKQKADMAQREQRASQATIKANLENLDGVIGSLSSGKVKTGGAQALIPGSKARAIISPEVQDVRDRVVNIVFQSLKAALGGQFTQKEAEQLVDSELNLSLGNEYNIPRLQRLRERIAAASGDPNLAVQLKSSSGTQADDKTKQEALKILKQRGAI